MNLAILKQIVAVRKKTLLLLAVVLTIAAAVQIFITNFQQPMLEKARSELLQQRQAEGRGAVLPGRDVIYRNGLNDFTKFRARIYPKNQFARFVSEIYAAVGRNNLEVSAISYKPQINKESNLLQYAMGLTVTGNYGQLKKFIIDLDNSGNVLHIDSVAFSGQTSSSDMVQLQVQFTAYFRMEAQ